MTYRDTPSASAPSLRGARPAACVFALYFCVGFILVVKAPRSVLLRPGINVLEQDDGSGRQYSNCRRDQGIGGNARVERKYVNWKVEFAGEPDYRACLA